MANAPAGSPKRLVLHSAARHRALTALRLSHGLVLGALLANVVAHGGVMAGLLALHKKH